MGEPVFGVVVRRVDNEPRPAYAPDLSVVGLIGPATGADPVAFPLNDPVKVYSHDVAMLTKLGESNYLADAIRGINDQLGETQFAAVIVVVRTAEGASADPAIKLQQTIAGVMGSSTAGTGMFAFLKAPDKLAVTPRLITAPGYTGQLASGVNAIVVGNGGSGYDPLSPPAVTFSGGGGGIGIVQGTGNALVSEAGVVTGIAIDTPGQWYTAAPTITIAAPTSGVQATATATINQLANPVVAGSTSVLNQLMAHAVFESSGVSEQGDTDWRETFQSQRIIPVVGGVRIVDPDTGSVVVRPVAPRIIGIGVRRDHEMGAPFHSWANQAVQGIVGPGRAIKFVLTDDGNEGQQLLRSNIGIIAKGELGNEFAIASSGFVFIGTDNAGDDPLWQFYNVTRGRDYIHLMLIRTLRFYLGRFNITGHTVQAVVNTMKFALRDLMADGHILGYNVLFNPDSNSPEQIRLGHLTVSFAAEEPPVLRKITIESSRYREAINQMVSQLAAQLNA